jgi:hypothetical protein
VKRSWRSAVAEVLLIFVGISLALFAENWNEERLERGQESELLRQILRDLEETKLDLVRPGSGLNGLPAGDLPFLEAVEETHVRVMRDFYRSDGADPHEFAEDFAVLAEPPTLFPQTAAYESLKTVGLDLVSNDSLRVAVTRFYELTLTRVAKSEATLRESSDSFLAPYVFEHFREVLNDGETVELAPRNADDLRADPMFAMIMNRILRDRARVIRQYRGALRQLDGLSRHLESVLQGGRGAL